MDELLVQIDGDGRAGWVLQDAGGDVVALAVNAVSSSGGAANGSDAVAATGVLASTTGTNLSFRIAAQQEYDAYGQVIWAEHLLNHAALHLGHKGLFVDRLDVGVGNGIGSGGNGNPGATACAKSFGEPPRIVPLAFNLAQNRNRVLHTSWGRFLQQDPNASGATTLSELTQGQAFRAVADALDLRTSYANGSNAYSYQSHNPAIRSDAIGLFDEDLDSAIDFALNLIPNPLIETYARTGVLAMRMARDLTQGYADNLSADVEWASDWNLSDDMNSRSDATWVKDITRSHMQAFMDNNDPFGPAYASVIGGGAPGREARAISQLWGDGPGEWIIRIRSGRSAEYQARITKKAGWKYKVGNVEFDGYSKGGVFIECKGYGYASFLKKGEDTFRLQNVSKKLARQASRQRAAVGENGRIVWHVAEGEAIPAIKKLVKDFNIIVVHSP